MQPTCLKARLWLKAASEDWNDKQFSALWVKSGNRGNLKYLKENDHYVLIFHRKMFIIFLSGAKLSTFYD